MRRYCLALLLILVPTPGLCQVSIVVDGGAEGAVGKQLIYQVEREIEDHSDYVLADPGRKHGMTLEVRALPYSEGSNDASVYSVTWTVPSPDGPEYFYQSTVGYCGYDRVDGTARQLVRRTDKYVEDLVEAADDI